MYTIADRQIKITSTKCLRIGLSGKPLTNNNYCEICNTRRLVKMDISNSAQIIFINSSNGMNEGINNNKIIKICQAFCFTLPMSLYMLPSFFFIFIFYHCICYYRYKNDFSRCFWSFDHSVRREVVNKTKIIKIGEK